MRIRIYYTVKNGGDGSSGVSFYESRECIDLLEEHDPEGYASGEGGGYFEIVVDGHFEPEEQIQGITIETLEDVKKQIEEDKEWES